MGNLKVWTVEKCSALSTTCDLNWWYDYESKKKCDCFFFTKNKYDRQVSQRHRALQNQNCRAFERFQENQVMLIMRISVFFCSVILFIFRLNIWNTRGHLYSQPIHDSYATISTWHAMIPKHFALFRPSFACACARAHEINQFTTVNGIFNRKSKNFNSLIEGILTEPNNYTVEFKLKDVLFFFYIFFFKNIIWAQLKYANKLNTPREKACIVFDIERPRTDNDTKWNEKTNAATTIQNIGILVLPLSHIHVMCVLSLLS